MLLHNIQFYLSKFFNYFLLFFQIEEGENRGPEMTAGLDANSATTNGAPGKKTDDGVFTVSVTGAYENDGFKVRIRVFANIFHSFY